MTVHEATRHEFSINGTDGILTTDADDDGNLASFELWVPDLQATAAGFAEAWYLGAKEGLRHGLAVADLVQMYLNTKFEPYGHVTGDLQIAQASSLVDYTVRRLAFDYLSTGQRHQLSIYSIEPPTCYSCGVQMLRTGSCFGCPSCGDTRQGS